MHGPPGESRKSRTNAPLYLAWTTFAVLTGVVLLGILVKTSGHFVYSLDDPYIHLALARRIAQGHYGLNAGEFSSPSSSVLWPFLLAPFATQAHADWLPLIVNLVCACALLFVFDRIVADALDASGRRLGLAAHSLLLLSFLVGTNLVGLVFLGLEHVLQALTLAVIAAGLLRELTRRTAPGWLILTLVLTPLIRYDDLPIALLASAWLFARGHRARASLALAGALAGLAAFSGFLVHLGLPALPGSVLLKLASDAPGSPLARLAGNLRTSLTHPAGLALLAVAIWLLRLAWLRRSELGLRRLAVLGAVAIGVHLVTGRYGWFHRYEMYIVCFSWCLATGLRLRDAAPLRSRRFEALAFAAMWALTVPMYGWDLRRIPGASSDIFSQQGQMARFASSGVLGPVAVNDIGLVAFRRDGYVLDMWGLASSEAFHARLASRDSSWMASLTRRHDVGLVMLYESWFATVPPSWQKLGELRLTATPTIVSSDRVSFFATTPAAAQQLAPALRDFARSLPGSATFVAVE